MIEILGVASHCDGQSNGSIGDREAIGHRASRAVSTSRRTAPACCSLAAAAWLIAATPVGGQEKPTPPPAPPQNQPATDAAPADESPFRFEIPAPEFPSGLQWVNAPELRLASLRGKFVLLDFWTFCCINCIHTLPELKKLEHAYPHNLVVIGVHSAKFDAEKQLAQIRQAVLRYEIEHPVVNDHNQTIWNLYGVRAWPTVLLIDPAGNAVWGKSGETRFEQVDHILKLALPYYRRKKLLDESPLRLKREADNGPPTALRFPGKVLADPAADRLFISDSNHNRVVITSREGQILDVVGSGQIGAADGDYSKATFHHPQGMALDGNSLFVADTSNHLIRRVDLQRKTVHTVAGTGKQFLGLPKISGGTQGLRTTISSPWALAVSGRQMWIAMAGTHQIWKMDLDRFVVSPYAGSGREDIIDGQRLPANDAERVAAGISAFAQPSGLTVDDQWLYVADSEGSSIRAVPLQGAESVRTVVGTAELPAARLFTFGDRDGPRDRALLQHPLGVVHHDGQLYVADTYNGKIKRVDPKTGAVETLMLSGEDALLDFDEPSGLSAADGKLYVADTNHHAIKVIDLESGRVERLPLQDLSPPPPPPARLPSFDGAPRVTVAETAVAARDGRVTLQLQLAFPEGWKLNDLAPLQYYCSSGAAGPLQLSELAAVEVESPEDSLDITIPVSGSGKQRLSIAVQYYFCETSATGLCKVGSVVFDVPLEVKSAGAAAGKLTYEVPVE